MEKPIVRDVMFLSQKCLPAEKGDIPAGLDLLDTLRANRARCVGLAANMIGVRKCIIVIADGLNAMVMFNPVITHKEDAYETEEGCLSLDGVRSTKRWKKITVEYRDLQWKKQKRNFTGLAAQIIQHETDHLAGSLI